MDYVPSHLCAVMCAFSSGTGSYAEMETLSTTVQESLNESQQICKVSMLCQHVRFDYTWSIYMAAISTATCKLSTLHHYSYKLIAGCILHKCFASQRLYIIVLFQLANIFVMLIPLNLIVRVINSADKGQRSPACRSQPTNCQAVRRQVCTRATGEEFGVTKVRSVYGM